MTDQHRLRLTEAEAEAHLRGICFKTGPPRAVGIELEWLLHDGAAPERPVTDAALHIVSAAAADLRHSRLTFEPGGQVELSSLPFPDSLSCINGLRADAALLRTRLAAAGLQLTGTGLDPHRPPRRILDSPRYAAMQEFFDRTGDAGRTMMCSTAAVQINVDAGPETPERGQVDLGTRWALLHELTPVLIAAFANSPVAAGQATGWRNTRAMVWAGIDPSRTSAAYRPGEDPRTSWARYALDATVLCERRPAGPWIVPPPRSFRDWLRDADCPAGPGDLDYHLTTLFPPVRARGHLEVRCIDAQDRDENWAAASVLVWVLVTDPDAAAAAREALGRLSGQVDLPRRAACDAMTDPVLAAAADDCFRAAAAGAERLDQPESVRILEEFRAGYVARGRCPADERSARPMCLPGAEVEEAACGLSH